MNIINEIAEGLNRSIVFEFIEDLNITTIDWFLGFLHLYNFHSVIANLRKIPETMEFRKIGYLAAVTKDCVYYNESLVPASSYEDILYIIAHETAHIERNDIVEDRMPKTRVFIGISLFLLFIYTILPLVVFIPILDELLYLTIRRHAETATDIKALDFVSKDLVLENIQSREPKSKFGWMLYDHATTNKFERELKACD